MAAGFFTQGIEFTLPHPIVPQRMILLLCTVIRRAWEILGTTPPAGFNLHSADEDAITLELVDIIENRLRKTGEVNGFDHTRFGRVEREPKISNFNKKHPDKMPDIVFGLRRETYPILSNQDGLFVECKPIDRSHSISARYCKDGLIRFVNGDYAWAMQDAMMIGYVASDYTFKKLAAILDDGKSGYLNTSSHGVDKIRSVYHSRHNRNFEWLEDRGPASSISVSHLWLSRIPPL
jgi:hypothetical protein